MLNELNNPTPQRHFPQLYSGKSGTFTHMIIPYLYLLQRSHCYVQFSVNAFNLHIYWLLASSIRISASWNHGFLLFLFIAEATLLRTLGTLYLLGQYFYAGQSWCLDTTKGSCHIQPKTRYRKTLLLYAGCKRCILDNTRWTTHMVQCGLVQYPVHSWWHRLSKSLYLFLGSNPRLVFIYNLGTSFLPWYSLF